MNLRDLRYLTTVAQLRHFGKAAEACFVSQPTLSTQLKKLEDELGVTLFERTNKQVLLTEEGAAIVAVAKRVLDEANHLRDLAKQFNDPLTGRFHLGFIPTIGPYLLPRILPDLKKALPNCEFFFYEEKTEKSLSLLKAGELDAVVLALPVDLPSLDSTPLFTDTFDLAMAHDHPLAKRKQVTMSDLDGHAFLLLEEGHCLRDQILAFCEKARTFENASYRATSLETLRAMVAASMGITLLPQLAIEGFSSHHQIKTIPFSHPKPERTIGLVTRSMTAKKACIEKIAALIKHSMSHKTA